MIFWFSIILRCVKLNWFESSHENLNINISLHDYYNSKKGIPQRVLKDKKNWSGKIEKNGNTIPILGERWNNACLHRLQGFQFEINLSSGFSTTNEMNAWINVRMSKRYFFRAAYTVSFASFCGWHYSIYLTTIKTIRIQQQKKGSINWEYMGMHITYFLPYFFLQKLITPFTNEEKNGRRKIERDAKEMWNS